MRSDDIALLLPAAYQRALHPSGPLVALLEVMEDLHAASEEQLSHVEDLFHPYRCPERMLAFLARWVAIDHLGSRRDLVKGGAGLAQSRGTLAGLRQAIQLSTGVSDVDIEEAGSFHLVIRLPAGCAHVEKIRHLVELEKPAATTFEIGVEP
ncbi:MAG TPA: phage tail protein [Candidatus Limnocylindrales bacterium]|nr:phage tail protein [Candidatus Limnocylindrales bacterium]